MIHDSSDGRLARLIPIARWLGPLIALIAFAVAYPIANQLQFDRTITSMFDPNDPDLQSYQKLQNHFGGNAVVMLVYRDADLWTPGGIERNAAITNQVASVEGVSGVISPSVLNDLVKKIRPGSFLSGKPPLLSRRDGVARGFDQMFVGYTHSPDHHSGAVVAMLDPAKVQEAIGGMQQITDQINDHSDTAISAPAISDGAISDGAISDGVLVGEPVLIEEAFNLIERDGVWLATLTITLLSIVVLLALADLRFVVLSIVVIAWSVVITQAVMQIGGMELSLVSTILAALATVITVTSILHLGVRYRIVRRRSGSIAQATTVAISLLGIPILWTCLTDAAGFAALGVSHILLVRQFGMMIAIAAVAVLLGLALWGPCLMRVKGPRILLDSWSVRCVDHFRGEWMEPFQRSLRHAILLIANWSVGHVRILAGLCLVAGVFIVTGIGRAKTETSFLNNFRPSSEIVQAYERVENEFGGAGVWDVVLEAPAKISSRYLKQVRALEGKLRAIDLGGVRLSKVISIADADVVVSRSRLMRMVSPKMRLGGMQVIMPVFYAALLTEPMPGISGSEQPDAASPNSPSSIPPSSIPPSPGHHRELRLMIRSEENMDADQKSALIAEVRRVIADSPIGESGRVTGYYVLMQRLIDQLVGDGWRCLIASSLLVWGLLWVSGRSVARATVALLVNLLPSLGVIAMLGWFGGRINMGSAMIAAVSIGLSIDGSVHFLSSYRRQRSRGHRAEVAAVHSAGNVGAAIVLATLALVIGFGGLATSEFVPTATFGGLVAVALVLGAIVNLTVLPALMAKLDG